MSNRASIDGNHNIIIQDASKSPIIIYTSDPDEFVEKVKLLNQEQLNALKKLQEEQSFPHHIEQVLKELISNSPIPKDLTSFISIPKEDIVGRGEDLSRIRKCLVEDKKLSLVNGMGGIGKTTLAAVYVHTYYDAYDHIAWLTIGNSLEDAIIANNDLLKNLKLQVKDMPPDQLPGACLNKLRTMNNVRPSLLILDNATEQLSKWYNELPKAPRWHVLVTAREKIEPFSVMELGFLSEAEAILLFQKYNDKFTEEEVRSIVKEVELHTLTIEILAKSAKRNRWDIETVQQAIIKNAKADITTRHSGHEKIDRIKAYLIQIFKISNADEQQKYLLQQFTVLPNSWISYELLYRLLQVKELEWKDDFSATLEDLYEKGYLLKDAPSDSYKMHSVLAEVLFAQLTPTLDDLKLVVESVRNALTIDQTRDNPADKFPFISFGKSILQRFSNNKTDNIIRLQMHLALVYKNQGQYEEARNLLEKALVSSVDNYGEHHPAVALCQSNLATVYQDLGQYDKAKDLLERALKSDISRYGEQHFIVAIRQSNLAMVYQNLGQYEKAVNLLEKALKSDKDYYGEQHSIVALRRSNLALAYQGLGQYGKAEDLLEKALKSDKDNYGKRHPTVARTQANLATVYQNLGQPQKARELLEKSLEVDKTNYGEQHPDVAMKQSNLAVIYQKLKLYKEALELLERAFATDKTYFGNQHPVVAKDKLILAAVYRDLKQYEKARELGKQAYDTFFHVLGEDHPNTKNAKSFLKQIEGK